MAEEVGVAFVRLVPSMRGFGPEAQQAMNDAMQGPARNAGEQAGGQAGGKFGGAFTGALAGAGVLAGAALIGGITEALDQGRITAKLGAQLGATPAEAKKYGDIAGNLYANAITEDFQGAADTVQATMRAGLLPPEATNKQIESISTRLADVATLMEEDVGQSARTVGKMIKTGLADNATEALDILTRGVQTGANEAEDLLDTFSEYSTQFRSLGLDGETAMGLISQGLKAGARDADTVADTLKEFSIGAVAGSEKIGAAWDELGLDSDKLFKQMGQGGDAAKEALDQTLQGLATMEPGVERNALALELFGTKAEDMGDALFALDPATAVDALGEVSGAADKAGDSLRDNASTKLTQFKRGLQQDLVEFLGGTVIPAVVDFRTRFGEVFGGIWEEAGKGSDGMADRIINAFTILGQRLGQKIAELAPKAVSGLLGLGGKIADFVTANPEKVFKIGLIAAALILAIVSLPLLVGAAISASAALMMIGFAKRLVTGVKENLPKWWASFTGWVSAKASAAGSLFNVVGAAIGRWFAGLWSRYVARPVSGAWNSFMGTVRALPGRALAGLSALPGALRSRATQAGGQLVSATRQKIGEAVDYVRGLPGRARSALGSLGGILASAGRSLINGFISGIKSKIGEVANAARSVVSAARDYFPFSPAKRGPFSGRGYTLYSGRALIQGFQTGITDQTPDLRAQLQHLPSAALQQQLSAAGSSRTAAAAAPTVVLDAHGMPRALVEWLRSAIRTDAGGSAEKFFKPAR